MQEAKIERSMFLRKSIPTPVVRFLHAQFPRSLPRVRKVTLGTGLVSVEVGLGVIRHVAIGHRVPRMNRLPVANGAAGGAQIIDRGGDVAVVAPHGIVVRTRQEVEPVIVDRSAPRGRVVADPAISLDSGGLMGGAGCPQEIGPVTVFALRRRIAIVSSRVAFLAIDRTMPPVKDKACLDMGERRWDPRSGVVALVAIRTPELVAMRVGMAARALPA